MVATCAFRNWRCPGSLKAGRRELQSLEAAALGTTTFSRDARVEFCNCSIVFFDSVPDEGLAIMRDLEYEGNINILWDRLF